MLTMGRVPHPQFARQFLEKGNYVLAGARDVRSPLLRDLEKRFPDNIFISEVDVESQNSIITWSRRLNDRTDHIDVSAGSSPAQELWVIY